jgi:predicted metal-dependent peptidase
MLTIGKQLTAEQRMYKATTDLIGRDEFVALAGVLMVGSKQVVEDKITACTNGRDEKYGRLFVDSLNDAEFRFLMLHECYHKMYRHLTTWKHLHDVDHDRANRACDYVINHKLTHSEAGKAGWIKMPEGGCYDEKYADMNAQEVFDLLQSQGGGGGGGGDEDGEGGQGTGFDDHDWDGAQELSEEEQDKLAKEIDEAVRQGAVMAGKVGSGGNRDLTELLEPKKDWRELLREYVKTTCSGKDYSTWRKPNRRYVGMDMLMPSAISEAMGEIVVAIDTSGSIGQRELNNFLGEIKGICEQVKPSKVHVMYWDTAVCRTEVYMQDELDNLVKSTKPAGGGGTDPACVPQYLNEHGIKPECVVMLTDGYVGGWGQWSVPVLWCILNNRSANPSVGVAVHIND